MSQIFEYLEKALKEFSSGPFYSVVLEAKKEYTILAGQINDDDDDFENRINAFNDWYVLQYISKEFHTPIIEEYSKKYSLSSELTDSFSKLNHSLFEYSGENFKKVRVVKDHLHDGEKVNLSKDTPMPGLLKGDLFTGRVIMHSGENYLLTGLCVLPRELRSQLITDARKVKRLGSKEFETNFLMKLEYFKTKWTRYSHLSPEKIFRFNN